MKTVILTLDDLRSVVRHVGVDALMDELIEALERVCLEHAAAGFEVPSRCGFEDGAGGLVEWMPVMQNRNRATVKIVGYHPRNPQRRNLPTILSVALSVDMGTGHLQALSDATFATALRTGAASAVASKVLAHPESAILGLIGTGAQAVSQVHALSRTFPLKEVLAFDLNERVSASFATRIKTMGIDTVKVRVVPLDTLINQADILCTATSVGVGEGPVFNDSGLKSHVHVNAVGSDFPGKTELPDTLLKRSFVAVDFLPQALKEGESQRLAPHEIGPDLLELVRGAEQYAAYRNRATVFDSTGFALEDHVVIELLHRYARQLGFGTHCQIEGVAADPTNPYGFLADDAVNAFLPLSVNGGAASEGDL